MSEVTTEIDIDAPPEAVWAVVMDPQRLGDWVTIHEELKSADATSMVQTMAIRGASFDVEWELVDSEEPRHALWNGSGPAGSKAETEYRLQPGDGGGTRFSYRNKFEAPGGLLGKAASKVVVGDVPEDEATKSLQRLKALCEGEEQG